MELEIKKGTKSINVAGNEEEIIFPHNLKFKYLGQEVRDILCQNKIYKIKFHILTSDY